METLTLIIFGITGNLAQIKLIPALYDMAEKGMLPENMSIIGIARTPMDLADFKKYVHHVLHLQNIHHKHEIKEEVFEQLVKKMHYLDGHLDDPSFYARLKQRLFQIINNGKQRHNVIHYLATYPDIYHHIFENLKVQGMNEQSSSAKKGWVRLMIEKPIGNDLSSAKSLNSLLLKYFNEDQIYRLDHYLGKETLQNILTFRFGNGVFEPLINAKFVDHIQITAAEDFGIGKRGGYYDSVGALKDVGQNHLLQMLAFATMDAPVEFSNEAVTKERVKILKSLVSRPNKIIFGQYQGYTKEENVNPNSLSDTYFAFKTEISSERFKSVPIYIRGGKKLAKTVTEISIVFKIPVNRLFRNLDCGMEPNVLIYRIQPNEGIVLKFLAKKPGYKIELDPTYMQFCYRQDPHFHTLPDPYERLLSDAIRGDQTFFNDSEEVEASWVFIDPLFAKRTKPVLYKPGSWGPKEADKLLAEDNRCWLEPSMEFCSF